MPVAIDSPNPLATESNSMDEAVFVTPNDGVGIEKPNENDVLCGRGGNINSHKGNEYFRALVEKRKRVYLTARFKREKRLIASSIVSDILQKNGRFLAKHTKSGTWYAISEEKARDKTSQALRENAPSIRAEMENRRDGQAPPAPTSSAPPQYYPPPPGHHAHPPPPYAGYPPPPYGYPPHQPPAGYHAPPPHHHHHGYYPPPPAPSGHYPAPAPPRAYPPPPEKSNMDSTAEYITSGAESFRKWAMPPSPNADYPKGNGDAISYVPDDRRRMVKFKEGTKRSRAEASMDGSQAAVMDDTSASMEPHHVNEETSSSLMTQVADRILGSFGSWDASTLCGMGATAADDDRRFFPGGAPPTSDGNPGPMNGHEEEEMAVEWEGQEVQLMDKEEGQRMAPPPNRPSGFQGSHMDHQSIGLSSVGMGSCHSWLPEQIGSVSSYFRGAEEDTVEQHSLQASYQQPSVNSFNRMFDDHKSAGSWNSNGRKTSMEHQGPIDDDDDDVSLISKSLSFNSGKFSLSNVASVGSGDMVWETKE